MAKEQAGLLILAVLGGMGLVMLVIGILILVLDRRKKAACTGQTVGTVVKYSYLNGAPLPVAAYTVGGVPYQKKRYCRAVITVRRTGKKSRVWMDEKDTIHVHGGTVINLRAWAEQLWPMGSPVTVYFNPEKPKQAYVERIPQKSSFVGWFFLWMGLGFVLVGLLFWFFLR
ncbi:MAG TPA: DUF3592 domain-containing protein [Candidatus Bariatricus faecipullorum]|nr:DUF3592 domain-containing protein [Candidatus Bariatricus faecipullorum]